MVDQAIALQEDHAACRVRELRAKNAASHASEDVARAADALKAAGAESIDTGLPDDPEEAARELERRIYELTNPPRRAQ